MPTNIQRSSFRTKHLPNATHLLLSQQTDRKGHLCLKHQVFPMSNQTPRTPFPSIPFTQTTQRFVQPAKHGFRGRGFRAPHRRRNAGRPPAAVPADAPRANGRAGLWPGKRAGLWPMGLLQENEAAQKSPGKTKGTRIPQMMEVLNSLAWSGDLAGVLLGLCDTKQPSG